jgi:hypothetical protein
MGGFSIGLLSRVTLAFPLNPSPHARITIVKHCLHAVKHSKCNALKNKWCSSSSFPIQTAATSLSACLSHPGAAHTEFLATVLLFSAQTHSGADLQFSASAAARFVPDSAKGYLGYVLSHSNDPQILPLIEAAVEARTDLHPTLRNNRCAGHGCRRRICSAALPLHGAWAGCTGVSVL